MNEKRVYDCLLEPTLQKVVSVIINKDFPLNTKYLDDLTDNFNGYEEFVEEMGKQYNLKGLSDD